MACCKKGKREIAADCDQETGSFKAGEAAEDFLKAGFISAPRMRRHRMASCSENKKQRRYTETIFVRIGRKPVPGFSILKSMIS